MEILKFPAPELYTKCTEVTEFNPALKHVLVEMFNLMLKNNGMGLAANQVGICKRMFVMKATDGTGYAIVNPVLLYKSDQEAKIIESCLSGDLNDGVDNKRAETITIEYQDETGKKLTSTFHRLNSVCVQHEMEHLEGKAFMHKYKKVKLPKNLM